MLNVKIGDRVYISGNKWRVHTLGVEINALGFSYLKAGIESGFRSRAAPVSALKPIIRAYATLGGAA